MASHLNKSACKKTLLDLAQTRHHKLERVSSDVYEHLDDMIVNEMKKIIATHPSVGCTIKMGIKKRKAPDVCEL